MTAATPHETAEVHTRLLKCALSIDESRAYWSRCKSNAPCATSEQAFAEFWFGAKSMPWVSVLITNMKARFNAFPNALSVLHQWRDMPPEARAAICHWHLQLTDPMYRMFTGEFLIARREALRPEIHRDAVISWVADQGPGRWTLATRKQLASKLLSAAFSAGLVGRRRDPRPLTFSRIDDNALTYLLYLLREVKFEGTMSHNPYLRSVGLEGSTLEARLRGLSALKYLRAGDVVDLGWRYRSLSHWAEEEFGTEVAVS